MKFYPYRAYNVNNKITPKIIKRGAFLHPEMDGGNAFFLFHLSNLKYSALDQGYGLACTINCPSPHYYLPTKVEKLSGNWPHGRGNTPVKLGDCKIRELSRRQRRHSSVETVESGRAGTISLPE